jgi:molybdate transport system ATP-binding protein
VSLSEPHLLMDFKHRIGTLAMSVRFAATAPWTVLFGPSGSGKSTILRVAAGLIRPDAGRVDIAGRTVAGEHIWLPAHARGVRWAGQRAMIFPAMTVAENLSCAASNADVLRRAVEHFGLSELAAKRPAELSGGERQRVSVARAALEATGKVMLLDEPFSGLDAGVRERLVDNLRTWLGPTPVVSVTHDVGEAFLLGAEVVRIDEGRVLAQGPVAEVLRAERDRLRCLLG